MDTLHPTLLTELHTHTAPDVYRKFAEEVGERHWRQRVSKISADIKANPFLAEYLRAENEIAFALAHAGDLFARYGGFPDMSPQTQALYPALAFAGQMLSIMGSGTRVQADRLRGRVRGALENPNDMRGLRLELGVATHFTRRGYRLEWPEMTLGEGTFDLLVPGLGRSGLEVECKSISEVKGRPVHRREALEFFRVAWHELEALRKNLPTGLSVVVTVMDKPPRSHADRTQLSREVKRQIHLGRGVTLSDGTDIRIEGFDIAGSGIHVLRNDRRPELMHRIIGNVTRTNNREGVVFGTDAGGALVLVLQSARPDKMLDATYRTLSDAAKYQLTGTKAGLLIAGLDGLDGEQLLSIAAQDLDPKQPGTKLAIEVSKFLSSEHRDHVTGVGIFSRSAVSPTVDAVVDSGGTAYYFPRKESPLWSDDLSGLFDPR